MATNRGNHEARETLLTTVRNWFPEDKPRRQLWFVLGLLFSSNVTNYVLSILITFLTNSWGLKLLTAVLITNLQEGLSGGLEIAVQFLTNAFLGYRWMLGLTTIAYSIGLVLLKYSYPHFTQSWRDDCGKNNYCAKKPLMVSFYTGLILITLGQSGIYLSLYKFEDLKDETAATDNQVNPVERSDNCIVKEKLKLLVNKILVKLKLKDSIAFSWLFVSVAGSVIGTFVLPDDPHAWTSELIICAWLMGGSFCFYFLGTLFYPAKEASGGSLYVLRVIVAALLNMNRPYDGECYDPDNYVATVNNMNAVPRCLNKAAIKSHSTNRNTQVKKNWRLCSLREVEDTKRLMRIVPLTTTFFMYGIVKSIGSTFFLEQAMNMNLGSNPTIALRTLVLMRKAAGVATNWMYDCVVEWINVRDSSYKADGIKIGLGMAMSFLCCSAALGAEISRLRTENMSVFWLIPQFVALGAMERLVGDGIGSFFEHEQSPSSMKEYAAAFADGVTGAGICFTLAAISIIRGMTKGMHPSFFVDTEEKSHLDHFYEGLLVVCGINFIFYVAIALFYWRNDIKQRWNQNQSASIDQQAAGPGA